MRPAHDAGSAAARAVRAPGARAPDDDHFIPICVVRNGKLAVLDTRINTATGDTMTTDGQPFTLATLTGEYAAVAEWYGRNDVVAFRGDNYFKYGIPRWISPALLERIGEYRGVPVFAEAGATASAEIIYLPDRPGCIFQTYTRLHSME